MKIEKTCLNLLVFFFLSDPGAARGLQGCANTEKRKEEGERLQSALMCIDGVRCREESGGKKSEESYRYLLIRTTVTVTLLNISA